MELVAADVNSGTGAKYMLLIPTPTSGPNPTWAAHATDKKSADNNE
jgi:hypothetical protein